MVWGLIVGVLLIVASTWVYRRGYRVYGVIGIALGIAALVLGYWFDQANPDDGEDVDVGTEAAGTPTPDEGGV